jgi:predicted O-methyltransferase YrrM
MKVPKGYGLSTSETRLRSPSLESRSVNWESLRRKVGANPIVRFGYKAMIVSRTPGALRKRPKESIRYLFRSREVSNYTYELSNMEEMIAVVADALGTDRERVSSYARELYGDDELREALAAGFRTNPRRNNDARYGKRTMDYSIIRARRPRVVVEVGTHDGLGTAVMLRAQQRNASEGDDGKVLCFDSFDEAGWLIPEDLRDRMSLYVGDARQTLEPVLQEHGVDYVNCDIGPYWVGQAEVYDVVCRYARGELVIRTEVVDHTSVLADVAKRHDAYYVTFRERPERHFAPGNLIGIAAFPHSD